MNARRTLYTGKPRLAITLGDPAGIGPEVILKALTDPEVKKNCNITIIGSKTILDNTYTDFLEEGEILANPNSFPIIDIRLGISSEGKNKIISGVGNAASGAASFAYLERAITQTLDGDFDAIVTGPISKSSWKAAGHDYPGQTEVLAQYAGVEDYGMLFAAQSPHTGWWLRTLLATTHIPLSQVPTALTPELMSSKLELLVDCLRDNFGLETPRIAISGLNPHSGEQGHIGTEEEDWLDSWIEEERDNYPEALLDGPEPPDTLWVNAGKAWYGNTFVEDVPEAYLALYHDQGLIPVKLMAFDRAVNTTIGLPFVRTSPDHGTAFDIVGHGVADETSMKAAIQLAEEFVRQKQAHS